MGTTTVGYYEDAIHASECARPDIAALIGGSSTPRGNRRRQRRPRQQRVHGSWLATATVVATVGAAVLSTVALVV